MAMCCSSVKLCTSWIVGVDYQALSLIHSAVFSITGAVGGTKWPSQHAASKTHSLACRWHDNSRVDGAEYCSQIVTSVPFSLSKTRPGTHLISSDWIRVGRKCQKFIAIYHVWTWSAEYRTFSNERNIWLEGRRKSTETIMMIDDDDDNDDVFLPHCC